MRAGSQAWYCYGNRTNSYLLVNYGFCFKDNLYNSVKFYALYDFKFVEGSKVADLACRTSDPKTLRLQQIRFKEHQLNLVLIGYLRRAKETYFYGSNPHPTIQLSKVTDLPFELSCMETYLDIINFLLVRMENKTTYLDDEQILADPISSKSWNEKMAMVYRAERKKTLHRQRSIAVFTI